MKVGIAGAGGLGSNCAVNLVRCGFSHFVIVDFDVIEPSNLNRQFYFLDQVGKPKVTALKDNLLRINADVAIDARIVRLDVSNIREMFDGCEVVVEAFDAAESKKMIAEDWGKRAHLFVSVSGIAGYGNADDITTRRISKSFYLVGDGVSEVNSNTPPCSPRVNVAAAKMADVILMWALDEQTI